MEFGSPDFKETHDGETILQIPTQRIGDRYLYGVLAPKDNPNWSGPWDCAEFTSWIVYQAAGILYGCEDNYDNPSIANAWTGYWARDVETLGQDAGFDPGDIDGEYGPQTAAAVSAFQAANGLVVDGEVGVETAAALALSYCNKLAFHRS